MTDTESVNAPAECVFLPHVTLLHLICVAFEAIILLSLAFVVQYIAFRKKNVRQIKTWCHVLSVCIIIAQQKTERKNAIYWGRV